jgi:hypothetical protein
MPRVTNNSLPRVPDVALIARGPGTPISHAKKLDAFGLPRKMDQHAHDSMTQQH